MSRNLFDDILLARGLKGLLAPPEMDNAVPGPGSILGGFDYRKPFENAGMENVLFATDKTFAPPTGDPPMSTNDIWRARALSAEFAQRSSASTDQTANMTAKGSITPNSLPENPVLPEAPMESNQPVVPQAQSWPTVNKDYVTEKWNNPREGGKNHQGVDFRNYFGDPVFSASDGVVTEINNDPAGRAGTYIMVRDVEGNLYGYAHTGATNGLKVGSPVKAGSAIGFSNSTGTTPSGQPIHPHLHFTYRRGTPERPATRGTDYADPNLVFGGLRSGR